MDRKKILIIEDEDICTQLVKLVIDRKDIDVVVATDGDQGIKMALSEKPDLIFLDIMLPKINGYDVVKTLRKDPAASSIPIVVLSARAGAEGKKMVLDTGCQEFIPKPFKVAQIKKVIERFLG